VVEDMREEYESLGTISVQVWRKQDFGRRAENTDTGVKNIGGIDAVPEKALKGRALSLATRYYQFNPAFVPLLISA
jgi:hypothetical protein